jgi:hypothetical protein
VARQPARAAGRAVGAEKRRWCLRQPVDRQSHARSSPAAQSRAALAAKRVLCQSMLPGLAVAWRARARGDGGWGGSWRLATHRMRLPVRMRIHCGIGRFCFSFLASVFFVLKVLLAGCVRGEGAMRQVSDGGLAGMAPLRLLRRRTGRLAAGPRRWCRESIHHG